MNCLDYRRALLAGEGESADMRVHRLQCVACGELFRDQVAFEGALRDALEVPVPAGFEGRLEYPLVQRRRKFLAAAAAGALAIGAGAYAWLGRGDPLALAGIDFIMKEEAKAIMMGAMPRAQAESELAGTLPLGRIERIGQIRHVGPCPFNGANAYLVVLAVPQGKVSLLVMPETTLRAGQRAAREGLYARVVSLRKGSVGVIGSDAAVVDSVAGALQG